MSVLARAEPTNASLRDWLGLRYVLLASAATALTAIALAVPTAIIANPWFTRMTAVEPEQYAFWILTSALTGALLATYVEPKLRRGVGGHTVGAGLLGVLAIGCPVCNKLVVAILGASGALTYFAPLQPVLGLGAVALAAYGLRVRLSALRAGACRRTAAAQP